MRLMPGVRYRSFLLSTRTCNRSKSRQLCALATILLSQQASAFGYSQFSPSLQAHKTRMSSSSSTNNKSYIDKLALILIENRKQLVVRSFGKTAFFTPGGKREEGESDMEALCREIKEELTVDLLQDTVKPYGVFEAQAFGKPQGTMVRMTCYSADYKGTLVPSEEVEEMEWITSDFPHDKLSVTGIMILEDLKAKDLID